MTDIRAQFAKHTEEFVSVSDEQPFVVFLCGPSLDPKKETPSSLLRKRIQDALVADKFTVILGEDDSIDNPEIRDIGINLQDSELEFVSRHCNAVVIVADSVGSFCELGLFSWHFAHSDGILSDIDFMLLVDERYEFPESYLNQGPALAIHGHGRLDYVQFDTYDEKKVVSKLRARRGTRTVDRRGRPRKRAA